MDFFEFQKGKLKKNSIWAILPFIHDLSKPAGLAQIIEALNDSDIKEIDKDIS